MAEDGLYVVNIIDGPTGDFLRAYVNTMRQTFPYVYLAPTQETWRAAPRTTFVVIGGITPLDLSRFESITAGDGITQLARLVIHASDVDDLLLKAALYYWSTILCQSTRCWHPFFSNKPRGRMKTTKGICAWG